VHGIGKNRGSVLVVSNVSGEKGSEIYIIWGISWIGDGSAGIVTRLRYVQLKILFSILSWGKGFCSPKHPDCFWGPHSLLFVRYWGFFTLGINRP
jgi:hypothetical protein